MSASAPRNDEPRPTWVERALGLFTEVRRGETTNALLLTLFIFLVLLSYYIVKVLREAFLLSQDEGDIFKSLSAGALAVVSVFVVKGFDAAYARYDRMKLLSVIFVVFAVGLVAFFGLYATAGASLAAGIAFFLFVGIYGAFIIAVFWSFANDIYTDEQGKRLFPLIGIGSTAGGVVGAYVAKPLMKGLGIEGPLLIAAGILLLCLGLARLVHRRQLAVGGYAGDVEVAAAARKAAESDGDEKLAGGFGLVFGSRYLLYMALLILVLNWVNSTGEYILATTVKSAAAEAYVVAGAAAGDKGAFLGRWIGGFYSDFYVIVNVAVVLIQALIVSRFLKVFGVRVALFVLPCVALTGYAAMALVPILGVVRVAKMAENSTDYSLQNTTQQALFLVTDRDEKYKAKAVIDTFFKRSGDVLSAIIVYIGTRPAVALPVRGYIIINLVLTAVWLGVVALLGREHKVRAAQRARAEEELAS